MSADLRAYLEALYERGKAFDASRADRLERRRNIEPESAALIATLIRHRRARRVLEIGTSNGYSTLWLADAISRTGGQLVSVEIDAGRSAAARAHLEAVSLSERVELVVGDAGDYLRGAEGAFDLILLDADRPDYPDYLPHLRRLLDADAGLLVVDNIISHADQVEQFLRMIESVEELECQVLPIGAGLLLAIRG